MYARSACQWRNSGGPTGSARTLEITVTRARAFGCRSAINNRSSCCAISKGTAGNASLVRSRSRYLYDKLASLSGHCHSLSSGRFQGSDSSDRRGCRGLSLCWAGPAASPSARPRTTGGGLAVNPPGPPPPAGAPRKFTFQSSALESVHGQDSAPGRCPGHRARVAAVTVTFDAGRSFPAAPWPA
jgi:hypothetical protein